jgi:hypothetical protein
MSKHAKIQGVVEKCLAEAVVVVVVVAVFWVVCKT